MIQDRQLFFSLCEFLDFSGFERETAHEDDEEDDVRCKHEK